MGESVNQVWLKNLNWESGMKSISKLFGFKLNLFELMQNTETDFERLTKRFMLPFSWQITSGLHNNVKA